MDEIRDRMLQNLYFSKMKEKHAHVVFKKYSTNRFGAISKKIVEKVVKLFLLNKKSELEIAKNYLCKEIMEYKTYSEKDLKKLVKKPVMEICENFVRVIQKCTLSFKKEKKKLLEEKQEATVQMEKLQNSLINMELSNKELENQVDRFFLFKFSENFVNSRKNIETIWIIDIIK